MNVLFVGGPCDGWISSAPDKAKLRVRVGDGAVQYLVEPDTKIAARHKRVVAHYWGESPDTDSLIDVEYTGPLMGSTGDRED